MRKQLLVLVLCIILCTVGCGRTSLSKDEIAVLRETYPIMSVYDHLDALVEVVPRSLDECIQDSEQWVWAKVTERLPDETEYAMYGASASKNVYQLYKLEVIESVFGSLEVNETFILAVLEDAVKRLPVLEPGREYLMGIMPQKINGVEGAYCTGMEYMFYVTEDDYVLSVTGLEKETEQQLSYTGQHITRVIESIRK